MKEVSEFFVVEFYVRAHDQKVFRLVCLGWLENGLETTWNDAFFLLITQLSHHGVGLSWTCLTISKNCPIISLQNILRQMFAGGFVNGILRGLWREDVIKWENFAIFSLRIDFSYG